MNTQPLAFHDLQNCLRRSPVMLLAAMKKFGGEMIVAGGFIRACVAGEEVNDIDCFTSSKDRAREIAVYIKDGDQGKSIHESDNAFTLTGYKIPIQIIHRWTFTDPTSAIESFDFTIARAAFWYSTLTVASKLKAIAGEPEVAMSENAWKSVTDSRFYADLASKRLVYCMPQRNEDAGGSMLRVLKYYQRGYRMPLDSLGAVMARLTMGVRKEYVENNTEAEWFVPVEIKLGTEFTRLLREVDPEIDPKHIAHLPSEQEGFTL